MFKPTPYEVIYSYDKLHNPGPKLLPDNLPPISIAEIGYMNSEGTILNPYAHPYSPPYLKKGFIFLVQNQKTSFTKRCL